MSEKYPTLSFVSAVMLLIGILVSLAGLYLAGYQGIIEPLQPGHRFADQDVVELGGGALLILIGLGAMAFGELVRVLVEIESNTRRTADNTHQQTQQG